MRLHIVGCSEKFVESEQRQGAMIAAAVAIIERRNTQMAQISRSGGAPRPTHPQPDSGTNP
jgi:hypothetical protein